MSTVTSTSDEIRTQVSQAYAVALEKSRFGGAEPDCAVPPRSPQGDEPQVDKEGRGGDSPEGGQTGCCPEGGQTGCCSTAPAGVAARSAGYSAEIGEHAEAAASSFGCGNPLAFAGVEPGQTVVDLGSGAGFDLLIAARKVGPEGHVIGVDMTDDMIEAARENAARAGFEQVEVRKGLIEAMPLADGEADWVISNCVINLSPEKERVFAEIHRVLKPGGRFSISDIMVEDLPAAIREHAAAYAACVAGAIPEDEYVAGLGKAGLVDVEVSERQVYGATELEGIVASDLESFGLDAGTFGDVFESIAGKVWSARVSGRRPE